MGFERNHNGIYINELQRLPQERYNAALERILSQIENGLDLTIDDCNISGMKNTEASWGLCSNSKTQWPDWQDWIFPDEPIAILHRAEGQNCPFDEKPDRDFAPTGCYYHCRIFQNLGNPPTREEAIERYRAMIAQSPKDDTIQS